MRALTGSIVFLIMGIGFYILAANDCVMKRKIWLVPSLNIQKKAIKAAAMVLMLLSAGCLLVFLLWIVGIVQ